MAALSFGLIAALAWGIHDILVRHVSLSIGILQSLFIVLLFGAIAQIGLYLLVGESVEWGGSGIQMAVASGLAFFVAGIGHYNAFSRGPLRLVAPIIGCYAVVSFLFAAFQGNAVAYSQWAMLLVLVVGIGLVARSSDEEPSMPNGFGMTFVYCMMAMFGFAISFAFGQAASAENDAVAMGLVARCVALLCTGTLFLLSGAASSANRARIDNKTLLILAGMGLLDAIALGVVLAAGVFERPEFASASSSIFGLVTVLLAWIFLREAVSRIQWLGIVLVFAAIAWLAGSA